MFAVEFHGTFNSYDHTKWVMNCSVLYSYTFGGQSELYMGPPPPKKNTAKNVCVCVFCLIRMIAMVDYRGDGFNDFI